MAGARQHEYPSDDILRTAVEEKGVVWTAQELGISDATLRSYLRARGLPTRRMPKTLELSDALKEVAGLVD